MSGSKSDTSLPAPNNRLWMLYCEHKTGEGDAETVEIKRLKGSHYLRVLRGDLQHTLVVIQH